MSNNTASISNLTTLQYSGESPRSIRLNESGQRAPKGVMAADHSSSHCNQLISGLFFV